jgi:hypothetical protein
MVLIFGFHQNLVGTTFYLRIFFSDIGNHIPKVVDINNMTWAIVYQFLQFKYLLNFFISTNHVKTAFSDMTSYFTKTSIPVLQTIMYVDSN